MEPLTTFTKFPDLPAELRVKIWRSVPRSQRLVSVLPCTGCWEEPIQVCFPGDDDCQSVPHEPMSIIAQPGEEVLFGPLEACLESRSIWLPHYVQLPRHIPMSQHESPVCCSTRYITYELDIFTIFSTCITKTATLNIAESDLFPGVDYTKIQNIGISGHAFTGRPQQALEYLRNFDQHSLKKVSVIAVDPRVAGGTEKRHWFYEAKELQLAVEENRFHGLQQIPLRVPSLLYDAQGDGLLSDWAESRILEMLLTRACLWHKMKCDPEDLGPLAQMLVTNLHFLLYVCYGSADAECPCPLSCCGPGGHSKSAMLEDALGVEVDCKMLTRTPREPES